MKKLLLFTITFFLLIQLQAQGWGQIQKIVASDRESGDAFGYAVAIDGDYAVVGAKFEGPSGTLRGAAYVYKKETDGTWVEVVKLEDPNPSNNDRFGNAVDIDGSFIIVGSFNEAYNATGGNYVGSAGAAYIYEKDESDNWGFVQKIVASDRATGDTFGSSVTISGNYAAVGAPREDDDVSGENTLSSAGSAYVFERDESGVWTEVQKLVASDRGVSDLFGGYFEKGIDMDGNFLVVGADNENEDENGGNTIEHAGSAYVFERNGTGVWIEVQKIVASDRQEEDWFGYSVALDNNTIVIGASQTDISEPVNDYTSRSGSAYVFERNGSGIWNETQILEASDRTSFDEFGTSVNVSGNHIIVGAYLKDTGATTDSGRAYIFEKDGTNTWNQIQNIYALDRASSDYFGFDVAISGDFAMVGAYQEDEDENGENTLGEAGSVYVFNANEPSTLSVVANNFETEIKAYPNPTKGNFTVSLGKTYNKVAIAIRSVLGQELMSKTYSAVSEIPIQINEPHGLYIVEIIIDNEYLSQLKLIKQ